MYALSERGRHYTIMSRVSVLWHVRYSGMIAQVRKTKQTAFGRHYVFSGKENR